MSVTTLPPVFRGPLDSTDAAAVAELGRVLVGHGFAGSAVLEALGQALPRAPYHLRDDAPLYLRRLAARTPLNTLIKLFVLLQPVEEADARDALAPLDVEQVVQMGILERAAGGVSSCVRVSGYQGLLLAHDLHDPKTTQMTRDHVLDINPTTTTLAALTVRRPARTALDVGTGCGALALVAARHTGHVVGVDTNPRALNFAAFNAQLNDIHNVEFRQGSLFDPVAGNRFDLIVCNPPYVISPDSRYTFRDGDRRGDSLCEDIVRRAPAYLEDGGFATVLCNWGVRSGEDWSATPRRWVSGSGCDTWLLCSATQDSLTYAALWNRGPDGAGYDSALDRWTAYHRQLGFDAIGLGAVILRRRVSGPAWVRTDMFPDPPLEPDDTLIARIFDAQDRLARLPSDDDMLGRTFMVARDHRLQQTFVLQDGQYTVRNAEIQLEAGLKFRGTVDPYTIHMLTRCDGHRTLGDIAADLAERSSGNPETIRRATAAIARRLVSLGFLIPLD